MRIFRYFLAMSIIVTGLFSAAMAQTLGSSPTTPAPKGTTLSEILECGEGYTSHELYDIKITVLDIFRGNEAWKRIQEADASNKPAAPGSEYILTRIRFEYQARSKPGICVHPLEPNQFTAYTASGEDYAAVSVVTPKPGMHKKMKTGDFIEGWLVFAVSKDDPSPLMSFAADAGGAVQHGEPKWFLLR